jgi:hypothetical protein
MYAFNTITYACVRSVHNVLQQWASVAQILCSDLSEPVSTYMTILTRVFSETWTHLVRSDAAFPLRTFHFGRCKVLQLMHCTLGRAYPSVHCYDMHVHVRVLYVHLHKVLTCDENRLCGFTAHQMHAYTPMTPISSCVTYAHVYAHACIHMHALSGYQYAGHSPCVKHAKEAAQETYTHTQTYAHAVKLASQHTLTIQDKRSVEFIYALAGVPSRPASYRGICAYPTPGGSHTLPHTNACRRTALGGTSATANMHCSCACV